MKHAVLAGALLLLASTAAAKTVRVFVVNTRVDLSYAATYLDYRAKMFAMVDAGHPRRAELVQPGVLDIATHLPAHDPSAPDEVLVLFPEDVGLVAGLIGSRGAAARAVTLEEGGSTTAFINLALAYQPQIQHYAARFPGRPGLAYLFLGATDTFYRAFYETFRDLAITYQVHVAASINVAPARRVTAAEDPELVAFLRDPDEAGTRDYAYEAVAGTPVNTLFVFAPDGEVLVRGEGGETLRAPSETGGVLRGSLDKAYLTPIEQSPLGLSYGAVRDLDVLDTAVGRLGSVTSKDAWMIDVNDRYDAKRPQLLIQAEAFDGWAFVAEPWAPDNFKAGGFAQVQRNPSFQFNAAPFLVGNLFDVTFDGQGAIAGKRRKSIVPGPADAWIGQNPDSGLVAVAPWIIEDPILASPALTLGERRAELAAAGMALLPGSAVPCPAPLAGAACENGYRESVVFRDLELADGPPAPRTPPAAVATAFTSARRIDPTATGEQRRVRLAARGDHVAAAWEDSRHGLENVYFAISTDAGDTFPVVRRVSDHPPGAVVELRPDVAVRRDGGVTVVWQEFCDGHDDDCGRIQLARFDAAGAKLGPDLRVDSGGEGSGKWNPVLALDRADNPLVAWIDERDHSPDGLPLEHVYFSRGRRGGRMPGRTVRVDRGAPVANARDLDHKWAPAIAARPGAVLVAWADFRDYQWDIFISHSRTGGAFGRNHRVDDASGLERLHDHPALAVDGGGTLHAVWADRRGRDPDTDIRYARSDPGGRRFTASAVIDGAETGLDPDRETPSNQWHPVLAVAGTDVAVAWQDNRLGDNDIFFTHSRDGGDTFAASERVDDSGRDPSDQYRPAIAIAGGRVFVAWEDERYGPAKVVLAHRDLSADAKEPQMRKIHGLRRLHR